MGWIGLIAVAMDFACRHNSLWVLLVGLVLGEVS
jgi:hypothetical protein